MKKLLLIGTLLIVGIVYGCPDKEVHSYVHKLLENDEKMIVIKDKRIIIDLNLLIDSLMLAGDSDEEKVEESLVAILFALEIYSKSHDLEMVDKEEF